MTRKDGPRGNEQFQRTGGNGFSSLVQSVFHSALVMEISLVPARDQRLLMQFI